MSIPVLDQKTLWGRAARLCSYFHPTTNSPCQKELIEEAQPSGHPTLIGENAHIEGERPTAARYRATMSDEERNSYSNLILLCREHHKIVDDQEQTYTVERLHGFKSAHEQWVRTTLLPTKHTSSQQASFVTEVVHSTLLHVQRLPETITIIPCSITKEDVLKEKTKSHSLPPLILRDRHLLTFADSLHIPDVLRPFLQVGNTRSDRISAFEDDQLKRRYLSELLRRCLNKITGHRGLHLDKDHDRYYFPQEAPERERTFSYPTVGGRTDSRNLVWRPKTRATGELKRYWVHLAVGLGVTRAAPGKWYISIRPEFHLTSDGASPLPDEKIGPRVTRLKSRKYNADMLSDVHFWRTYLSDNQPRILLDTGGQALIISSTLEQVEVRWPGVANDAKPYKTAVIEDDLFSVADLARVVDLYDDTPTQDA